MKIIKPSVELMRTGYETESMTPEQLIEKVGRTCYKSEDKITEDSAVKFVGGLIKRKHEAMIEHYSPIFRTDPETYEEFVSNWDMLLHNGNLQTEERLRPYLRFTDRTTEDGEIRCIISGNMRAWRDYMKACDEAFGFLPSYLYAPITEFPTFFSEYQDNDWDDSVYSSMLNQISVNDLVGELEHDVHHDVTAKFICDRGISHETVRHRTASFAQESTRYCNYSGDKFEKSVTYIEPLFVREARRAGKHEIADIVMRNCENCERDYFELLELGCTPQEARGVLNTILKTEVIVTMSLQNWKHFFGLRCAPDAHPDMRVSALEALGLFEDEVFPYV